MGDHWQVSKKPSPENQIRDFGRWGGDRLASVNTERGDNIGLLIHDEKNWGISLNLSLLKYDAKEASFYYVYICLSCPFYDFYFYKILIWWRMVSSHFIWSIQYISYWLHLRNVPVSQCRSMMLTAVCFSGDTRPVRLLLVAEEGVLLRPVSEDIREHLGPVPQGDCYE